MYNVKGKTIQVNDSDIDYLETSNGKSVLILKDGSRIKISPKRAKQYRQIVYKLDA